MNTDLYQMTPEVLQKILAGASIADNYSGKRRELRHEFQTHLDLFKENTDGSHRKLYVAGKDISADGIGLTCREKLPEGEQVVIVLEHEGISLACHARVARCTETTRGYQAGLVWEFD